jgi:hypothetical protein
MVNSIGCTGSAAATASVSSAVGALNGRIRDDKMKLDDWTTCVSAKTVKGQAEIQRLSGQVSADREAVLRAQAAQTPAAAPLHGPSSADPPSGQHGTAVRFPAGNGSLLDVWA